MAGRRLIVMMNDHDGSRIRTAKKAGFGQQGKALEDQDLQHLSHRRVALGKSGFLVDNQGATGVPVFPLPGTRLVPFQRLSAAMKV